MEERLSLIQRLAWWLNCKVLAVVDFADTVRMVQKSQAGLKIEEGCFVPEPNAKWFTEQALMVIADNCRVADAEKRPFTQEEMQLALLHLRHTTAELEKALAKHTRDEDSHGQG